MALHRAHSPLPMRYVLARAREFFELRHGLALEAWVGTHIRWRGAEGSTLRLRVFPWGEGGTRLELEGSEGDALIAAFLADLPDPGPLDPIWRR